MQQYEAVRREPLSRNWSPTSVVVVKTEEKPSIQQPIPPKTQKSTPAPKMLPRKTGPKQASLTSYFGNSSSPISPAVHAQPAKDGLFYNESLKHSRHDSEESPLKKRRISVDEEDGILDPTRHTALPKTPRSSQKSTRESKSASPRRHGQKEKYRGGFIVDSDDSDADSVALADDSQGIISHAVPYQPEEATTDLDHPGPLELGKKSSQPDRIIEDDEESRLIDKGNDDIRPIIPVDGTYPAERPPLVRQDTSLYTPGEFGDEDFEQDEFAEDGEEFMERQWMAEQEAMEAAFDEDSKSESGTESVRTPQGDFDVEPPDSTDVSACPICCGSLKGLTEAQASSHVNACLDGTAPPLPRVAEISNADEPAVKSRSSSPFRQPTKPAQRFQRAAIARPPQASPFTMAKETKTTGSAFTKLMSGHAEDLAWAEAASNEKDSRGKPAYQRTCPFYKIMPGLSICVDAFRYGKVEGQNAYFLSHFHSDHYIGLTANWSHGPIYASKVTCNLMRQCLKVDPKWIRPLEFEKKYEVPNTNGVRVTMIPANHCPGSSLYLFEKLIGKNKDGSDRLNRVLHCGDFRACPAHVNHPLLKPSVVDAVSGATKDQWIDTCYLDTTYLTPKYAFPSQSNVIDACAAMCVSLSNEIADPNDSWESTKAVRMGSTMSKFLEAGAPVKAEPEEEEEDSKASLKPRGRLLVVIGTYSIGKERICLGIAKALNSKIYAPPNKMAICRALEDKELNARLTSNKYEAQVHMQILFEIRAETLHDYLVAHKPHFSRVVGFRPTGWNYRPPTSRFTENPGVDSILHSDGWKSRFTMRDLVPQRGSTKESNCFGVPYSEHSSFRELTMFCCALRIKKVVPTVNVGSAKGREKMKKWIEKWETHRRKQGFFEWAVGTGGSGGDTEKFEGLHYGV